MQKLQVCVYDGGAGDRVGSVDADRVYDLNLCCVEQLTAEKGIRDAYRLANNLAPSSLGDFLRGGDNALSAARQGVAWVAQRDLETGPAGERLYHSAKDVTLRAPILPSTKVICMGDTYQSHADLAGVAQAAEPGLFFKMSQVVVGPDEWVIILKSYHPQPMVYDTELTVVIGKAGMSIPEDRVEEQIWGYTILNDLTLRGAKSKGPRYKVFETSAPVGPWIVPKDQVADRGSLKLSFRINGKQVREGSTSKHLFSIPSMIAEVSKYHALRPGDIIATGGPGATEVLDVGDIMEAEIEGIGTLRNPIKLED